MVKLGSLIWVYKFFWAGSMAQNEKRPADNHTIYVSSINWHTGIVVPAYALPDSLWAEYPEYKSYTYLEIGWGDADFYTHEGFNLLYAFKTVFWPTSSVLHLNPIDRKVESSSLRKKHISLIMIFQEPVKFALNIYVNLGIKFLNLHKP
ncbi:DUF2459 domain-containing protein [Pleomorphovibrio marinus]|uniref:DUF2459 domain-containing protein n=1 Tax=Pleomorphovibrio marinus TaxID=2164132 RepID=UPI0018E52511|nr:DUF2459 domain-containing protein [Pleomorphovibrio marinus]